MDPDWPYPTRHDPDAPRPARRPRPLREVPSPAATDVVATPTAPATTEPVQAPPRRRPGRTTDRWWSDGRTFLATAFHDDDPALRLGLDLDAVPDHIVRRAITAVVTEGPTRFDDTVPPATAAAWRDVVQSEVDAVVAERHRGIAAARRALRHLRRPKTTLRALAATVEDLSRPRHPVAPSEAEDAVFRAHRAIVAGTADVDLWPSAGATADPVADGLALVVWLALRLVDGAHSWSGNVPNAVVEALAATGGPTGIDAVATMVFDGLGPYAIGTGGAPVVARARAGLVVQLGPPGSGKSLTLRAVAATAQGAVVILTTKPWELWEWLAVRRGGRRWVVDPTGTARPPATLATLAGFDPLSRVQTFDDARGLADVLVQTQGSSMRGVSDSTYWAAAGADLLAPLLLHSARRHESLPQAYACLIDDGRRDRAADALAAEGEVVAAALLRQAAALPETTRQCVVSTAAVALRSFATDVGGALEALAPVDLDAAVADGDTIVLVADEATMAATAGLFSAFIDALVDTCRSRQERHLPTRCHLFLDEAANAAPHPRLGPICSVAPGYGLHVSAAFQGPEQIARTWGPAGGELLDDASLLVIHPGVANVDLRARVSSLIEPATGLVPPPPPGEVIVVDEHSRVMRARSVTPHLDPAFVWNELESAALLHPAFLASVAGQRPAIETAVGS